jgi:hypothetical protein
MKRNRAMKPWALVVSIPLAMSSCEGGRGTTMDRWASEASKKGFLNLDRSASQFWEVAVFDPGNNEIIICAFPKIPINVDKIFGYEISVKGSDGRNLADHDRRAFSKLESVEKTGSSEGFWLGIPIEKDYKGELSIEIVTNSNNSNYSSIYSKKIRY